MNWKKAAGFGILLWLIMFAFVSAFLSFYTFTWMRILCAFVAGVISFVLAHYARPTSAGQALGYGLSWVIVGVILDLLITMRFNATFFTDMYLWLGYLLAFLAPLLRIKKSAVPPASQPTI